MMNGFNAEELVENVHVHAYKTKELISKEINGWSINSGTKFKFILPGSKMNV
jgi:hypothetical protein